MIFSEENKKNIAKNVNVLTQALVLGIDKYFPREVATEEWKSLSDQEKNAMRRIMFEIKYGVSEKEFANDIYQKIIKS